MYEHPHSKISITVPVNHFSLCRAASAERIELFLSLSGFSHPWLGELGRSVFSASVEFLEVGGGFSGC